MQQNMSSIIPLQSPLIEVYKHRGSPPQYVQVFIKRFTFFFYIWLHNEDFFIPWVESAMNLPSLSLSPHSLFIFWFSWTKCRLSTSQRVTWKQIISQRIWCMQSTLIWARSSITGLRMLQGHRGSTLCIFSSSKRFGEFHNVPSPHHFCPSVFVCFSPRGLWSCF